jgi:oligoendopeptidase F
MGPTFTEDEAMSEANGKKSSAAGVAWDLTDLYQSVDDPKIGADLDEAKRRAAEFEKKYRNQIDVPGGPAPEFLRDAVRELEGLYELMDRPLIYASLLHASKTDDPRHGALYSRTQELRTAINKHLIFFDLEWCRVADEPAGALLAHPELAHYRHYVERVRVFKPHRLTEPEEKILDEKSLTGRAAIVRLFDESVSGIRCPLRVKGKTQPTPIQQVLSGLYDPDRNVRKSAAAALTKGLQDNARLLTFLLNTVVQDHRSDCNLRRYPGPMAPRHLANEITPESVDALMAATEKHQKTVQRYYKLKKKLLGVRTLYDYDRYAPLFPDLPRCDWETARRTVTESYEAFSPQAGAIVRDFFDRRWIDAEPREGKRGGAFSASAVPSVHPYILMSYEDRLKDVMTLAHELGHGVHQYLSRKVGYLQCDTPLTTAETASVFGEMLTFRRLQQVYSEPKVRLAMLCSKIEDAFATVFRQVVLTRFEQAVHQARQEQGELPAERLNELWMAANQPMFGKVVKLTDDYACWWMYIGHFIHSPFYCYAYAFGELLVLALVQKYKQEGEAFVPKYLDLLASGGSEAPHVLLKKLDVDVNDPSFWGLGLQLLDEMVREAEELAEQVAPPPPAEPAEAPEPAEPAEAAGAEEQALPPGGADEGADAAQRV